MTEQKNCPVCGSHLKSVSIMRFHKRFGTNYFCPKMDCDYEVDEK